MAALARRQVVNDVADDRDVVIFYSSLPCVGNGGTATVDTASVYNPWVGERRLTFYPEAGVIIDRETGSSWSTGGLAVRGPLQGSQLQPLPYTISYWFSWVAFHPDTALRLNQ